MYYEESVLITYTERQQLFAECFVHLHSIQIFHTIYEFFIQFKLNLKTSHDGIYVGVVWSKYVDPPILTFHIIINNDKSMR